MYLRRDANQINDSAAKNTRGGAEKIFFRAQTKKKKENILVIRSQH